MPGWCCRRLWLGQRHDSDTAAPNRSNSARSTQLTVNGQSVSIPQEAPAAADCLTYELTPQSARLPSGGGEGNIAVHGVPQRLHDALGGLVQFGVAIGLWIDQCLNPEFDEEGRVLRSGRTVEVAKAWVTEPSPTGQLPIPVPESALPTWP